jgi:hypothetical protein
MTPLPRDARHAQTQDRTDHRPLTSKGPKPNTEDNSCVTSPLEVAKLLQTRVHEEFGHLSLNDRYGGPIALGPTARFIRAGWKRMACCPRS